MTKYIILLEYDIPYDMVMISFVQVLPAQSSVSKYFHPRLIHVSLMSVNSFSPVHKVKTPNSCGYCNRSMTKITPILLIDY